MQCAETAHGQAGDAGILRAERQVESSPDIVHQFLSQHGLESMSGGQPVQIEGILRRRHDDGKVILLRQFIRHIVAGLPRIAVQQEQRFHRFFFRHLRCVIPRIVRDQDFEGGLSAERFGVVLDPEICHGFSSLSFTRDQTARAGAPMCRLPGYRSFSVKTGVSCRSASCTADAP